MDEDADLISSVAASVRHSSSQGDARNTTTCSSQKPANKSLLRLSRCSSVDSQPSQPPRSPFQSNPLLTAHDYAKSPLMEGCPEPPPTPQTAWSSIDGDHDDNDPERSNASSSVSKKSDEVSSNSNDTGDDGTPTDGTSSEKQVPVLGDINNCADDHAEVISDERNKSESGAENSHSSDGSGDGQAGVAVKNSDEDCDVDNDDRKMADSCEDKEPADSTGTNIQSGRVSSDQVSHHALALVNHDECHQG
jgi:hypothetical protein